MNFNKFHSTKGVSLIIVIFAMMLLAILGWSLAVLQSTDFESSLRQTDSERALYLAESGAQWGLRELSEELSCSNFNNPVGILHTLDFGQYRVKCSCNGSYSACINKPELTIESWGYVPSEGDFRTQRDIRLVVTQGAFSTAGSVRNLLDWSGMLAGSEIDGDLRAGHFDGDGDVTYDELCEDYGVVADCGKQLPLGDGKRTQGETTIPTINMAHFEEEAENKKDYSATSTIKKPPSSGTKLVVSESKFFKKEHEGEIIRNLSKGTWAESDWAVIISVKKDGSNEATLDWAAGDSWSDGEYVRVVKRFEGNHNNEGLWYIKGSDIIIDVRTEDAKFKKTSLFAEGDIIIKGSKGVDMDAHVKPSSHETFPNLITQGGSIYSKDYPDDGKKGRKFKGLIYTYEKVDSTERGNVWFNCIDGTAIMGYKVTLEGKVELKYDPKYIDSTGFLGALSTISWQEQ
jgi:hypothetical protein